MLTSGLSLDRRGSSFCDTEVGAGYRGASREEVHTAFERKIQFV